MIELMLQVFMLREEDVIPCQHIFIVMMIRALLFLFRFLWRASSPLFAALLAKLSLRGLQLLL
jgi:hypothetical protein